MASDSLKQVGKYIGKTGRDADRALKRVSPIQPRLERVRDVFDSSTEFSMSFNVLESDERVLLDLFFQLPPPIRGCKAGCIFTKCEEFTFESGGNHYVVVQHPYLRGSVSVYVNGEKLSDAQINEVTPEAGEVFYQGTSGPDTVAVCYVYTDCPQAVAPMCVFELGPSFSGGLLAFSDRFDKTPSIEPWGGYGYWYTTFGTIETPVKLNSFSGVASINHYYTFEDIRGSGIISEIIMAVEFSNSSTGFTIDLFGGVITGQTAIFGLSSTGTISLQVPYRYKNVSSPDAWSFSSSFQLSPLLPFTLRQKLFLRWRILKNSYEAKVWPMDQEEPSTWFQFTNPLPTFPHIIPGTAEWINYDFIGSRITGNVLIHGIEHWVGSNSGVYGRWHPSIGARQELSTGYSWVKGTSAQDPQYIPGGTYLQAGFYTDQFYEFNTGNNTNLENTFPGHAYHYVTPFFGPTYAHVNDGTQQVVVSFRTTYGKATSFKIVGEVRWTFSSATQYSPSSMTIVLDALAYGEGVPPVAGKVINGTAKAILGLPVSPADSTFIPAPEGARWRSAWTPFEIEIPTTGEHVQWGARFLQDSKELEGQLGNVDVDSILRDTFLNIEFRRVYTEATMAPLGPARTICPGGALADRCATFSDSFNQAQTFDNCSGDIYYMNSDSGQQWEITDYLTKLETNGVLRATFRAPGVTTDGSDGRCPIQDMHRRQIDKSLGWSTANLAAPAPPACGNFSISAQFKFGEVGDNWIVTHSDNPTYIGQEMSPFARFRIGQSDSSYLGINLFNYTTEVRGNQVTSPFVVTIGNIGVLSPHTLYSIYIESTSKYYGAKIWAAGSPTPDTWAIYGAPYSLYQGSEINLLFQYSDYIDDNFYMELSNLVVTPLETVI